MNKKKEHNKRKERNKRKDHKETLVSLKFLVNKKIHAK
jgi:hypothetical protein